MQSFNQTWLTETGKSTFVADLNLFKWQFEGDFPWPWWIPHCNWGPLALGQAATAGWNGARVACVIFIPPWLGMAWHVDERDELHIWCIYVYVYNLSVVMYYAHIHTYGHTYIQRYIHTYIHTSTHPSIHPASQPAIHPSIHHSYIHTYIHSYILRMGIQSKPTLTSPVYRVMQATARGHKTDDPSAQDPKLQVSEKTNAMRPFVLASLWSLIQLPHRQHIKYHITAEKLQFTGYQP